MLFGQHHLNLARIEQKLPVSIVTRGNEVFIQGESAGEVRTAATVLEDLYAQLKKGRIVGRDEVDASLRMAMAGDGPAGGDDSLVRTERRLIAPRSPNQAAYLRLLERHDLVFALGPAGTGKTYLAVAMAVAMLKQRRVERIILSRPAVEAGERLGFLPGDLAEKVDPYLAPIWDALRSQLGEANLKARRERREIEVAPLAFMRGRTLNNAFIIVDEAQNATILQMKMVLTRLGAGSRMIVTGDPSQVDLPGNAPSGLNHALSILSGIPGIEAIRFSAQDVVRHRLVARIVEAYDGDERRRRAERDNG